MRYFFDLEFSELQLISIAIVSEDGREFYAENCDVDWSKVESWITENVKPYLSGQTSTPSEIREGVREFVGDDPEPEFWGYNCAYDWTILTHRLFGRLLDIPKNWPKRARELKELKKQAGEPKLPAQQKEQHNCIFDARWNKQVFIFLAPIAPHFI